MDKQDRTRPLPRLGWNLLLVPSLSQRVLRMASGPGCKENFSGWGFSLPIALPERKFHALRISRQSALEVELAVKAMWAGHGGWEGRQSSRGLSQA